MTSKKSAPSEAGGETVAPSEGTAAEASVEVGYGSKTCAGEPGCDEQVVYYTDGVATPKRGYCRKHLPANVTPEMLEEQQSAP